MAEHVTQADSDISTQKQTLRTMAAATRKAASVEDPEASVKLAEQVAVIQALLGDKPQLVAGYWPIRTEIDPRPLMQALQSSGHRLCLPSTPQEGLPLKFHRWSGNPDDLEDGPYGTKQPNADLPDVRPNFILAPLLAFDKACWRLGYGGGFYDRTLAALESADHKVRIIGLAYTQQQVESVPTGLYDRQLDGIFTQDGLVLSELETS